MIEKVRLKTQIIWYFPSILIVVKITRPLRFHHIKIISWFEYRRLFLPT